ncbi:MAG: hypothetical protein RBR08_02535 [Desulforegulaceae bacterium]|nr:hypothetical protein [Desulforegulaceae bacterium]
MEINPYLFSIYGLFIVFSGLALLSFAVSNIHRVIFFFENLKLDNFRKKQKKIYLTQNIRTDVKKLFYLSDSGNGLFYLPDLIEKALMKGQENPWIIIDFLLKKNIICPDETGKFFWNDKSDCWKQIFKK